MVLCCGDDPVAVVLCTRRSGEVMPHGAESTAMVCSFRAVAARYQAAGECAKRDKKNLANPEALTKTSGISCGRLFPQRTLFFEEIQLKMGENPSIYIRHSSHHYTTKNEPVFAPCLHAFMLTQTCCSGFPYQTQPMT